MRKHFHLPSVVLASLLCLNLHGAAAPNPAPRWPTPNTAFFTGAAIDRYIEPTPGNETTSGLFGSVRNNGYRFHEGLDMKPVQHDRRGRVTDPVYAALPGTVAYLNKYPGNSGYGYYVVLEHDFGGLQLYTLYAHLASLDGNLTKGEQVAAGTRLGTMGRSAGGYVIPVSQTHLHFEIGVRLTNHFQSWYDWSKTGGPNHHGVYNGINLIGMDPLEIFEKARTGKFQGYRAHMGNIPRAFALRVYTSKIPDFVLRNPALLTKPVPPSGVVAWDVDFSWYAMPLCFTPKTAAEVPARKPGDVRLLGYAKELIDANKSRSTIIFEDGKPPRYGKYLTSVLQMLFGLRN